MENSNIKAHPNLVEVFDINKTESNIYVIMELCDQTLEEYITLKMKKREELSEKEVKSILVQLLQGTIKLN